MKLERSQAAGFRPEMMRLAEVAELMSSTGTMLSADPSRGLIEVVGELPDWAITVLSLHYDNLVLWWTMSPAAILVCDSCGQWKLSGKKSADGGRCFLRVGKSGCQGAFRVVELPWVTPRPKRKRIKLKAAA